VPRPLSLRTPRRWTRRRMAGVGIFAFVSFALPLRPLFALAPGEQVELTRPEPSRPERSRLEPSRPEPSRPEPVPSTGSTTVPSAGATAEQSSVTQSRGSTPTWIDASTIGLERIQVLPSGEPAELTWELPNGLRADDIRLNVRSGSKEPQRLTVSARTTQLLVVELLPFEARSVVVRVPPGAPSLLITATQQDPAEPQVCSNNPAPISVEPVTVGLGGTWLAPTTLRGMVGGARRNVVIRPARNERPTDDLAVAMLQLGVAFERQNAAVRIETDSRAASSPFLSVVEVSLDASDPGVELISRARLPIVSVRGDLSDIQTFSALIASPAWTTVTGDRLTGTDLFPVPPLVTRSDSKPVTRVDTLSRRPRYTSDFDVAQALIDVPQAVFGGPVDTMSVNFSGTVNGANSQTTVQLLFDGLVVADSGPLDSRTFAVQASVELPNNLRSPQFVVRASTAPTANTGNISTNNAGANAAGGCGSGRLLSIALDDGSTISGSRFDPSSVTSETFGRLGQLPQFKLQQLSVAVDPFDTDTLTAAAAVVSLLTRSQPTMMKLQPAPESEADIVVDAVHTSVGRTGGGVVSNGNEATLFSPEPGKVRMVGSKAALRNAIDPLQRNWEDMLDHGYLLSASGARALPGVAPISVPLDPSIGRPIRYRQASATGAALGFGVVCLATTLRFVRKRFQ
jgi:hypothetical protein